MTGWHRAALILGTAGLAAVAAAPSASARVGVFFGFGPPVFYPPPAYYPPPPYYAPPPAYYPPPPYYPPTYYTPPPPDAGPGGLLDPGQNATAATSCYAGAFVCPMQTQVSIGSTCWCPDTTGARVYGRAG